MSRAPQRFVLHTGLAFLGGLVGCGDVAREVSGPPALASQVCTAAPEEIGVPRPLAPGTSCVELGLERARYAVAFFDTRFVQAARVSPELLVPEQDPYTVTIRAGTGIDGGPITSRALTPRPQPRPDDDAMTDRVVRLSAGAAASPACPTDPGFGVFCHERLWSPGDTLTLPESFGLFTGGSPRAVQIFLVRAPFVFSVSRSLREDDRARLEPILTNLAKIGILRVLPLLRRTLLDRPVHTSLGSQQILVDIVFDRIPVCVCGVTVGQEVNGIGMAGVSLRLPDGLAFEADRVGLFAHELTHVWQLAYEAGRSADPASAPPTTSWALEGGADLVRQEVLRGLSLQPLAGNRDASQPAANIYLDRMLRNLRVATGRIRDGYGQTAGFLRQLFLDATRAGSLYEPALSAVLLGALEGWYPSTDPTYSGDGLAGRLGAIAPGFDPTRAVLLYALANAADDRTKNADLQNHTVLDSWRESLGSRFVPEADVGTGGGVTLSRESGSVGYVYFEHDGTPARLSLEADIPEVRWMMVRFE